jgi:hypothetical protein
MAIYGSLVVGVIMVSPKIIIFRYEFCLGEMNDLWIYDGGNWALMSGSSSSNPVGSYGEKGVASPSNIPGGRYAAAGWRDNDGNFWIFGGIGHADEYGTQITMKN